AGGQPRLDDRRLRDRRRLRAHLQPPVHHPVLLRGVRGGRAGAALHAVRAAHAGGDAEPVDGAHDGHQQRPHRCTHLRPRLRYRRHRRCRAQPDRQRQPESRPALHRRFLHGGGLRRGRQPGRHPRRCDDPRHRQQVPRAGRRRRPRQGGRARSHHPFHTAPAAGALRPQGPGRGELRAMRLESETRAPLLGVKGWAIFIAVGLFLVVAVPLLNALPPSSPVHVPDYLIPLLGKYLCYALLALSVDLIWGYCGILSLGHGAFFALGGYAMGMYLMRQIGERGVYGHPILPDFMVFLNWDSLPWYWYGFDSFAFAMLMVILVPGLLALVFGWLAFRSRITGVYFSIITQAMVFALMLAFFRNDFGFGGNNGLTDFKEILGFNVHA